MSRREAALLFPYLCPPCCLPTQVVQAGLGEHPQQLAGGLTANLHQERDKQATVDNPFHPQVA